VLVNLLVFQSFTVTLMVDIAALIIEVTSCLNYSCQSSFCFCIILYYSYNAGEVISAYSPCFTSMTGICTKVKPELPNYVL